jgi:hypothetical protein
MGYLDGLTASSFKKGPDGREIFYPFGIYGGGRVAPSEAEASALKNQLKWYMAVSLVGVIALQLTLGIIACLAAVAVSILWFAFLILPRTAGWERTAERLTFAESMGSASCAHGKGTLIFLLVISLALLAASAWFLAMTGEMVGLAGVAIFIACTAVFGVMLAKFR